MRWMCECVCLNCFDFWCCCLVLFPQILFLVYREREKEKEKICNISKNSEFISIIFQFYYKPLWANSLTCHSIFTEYHNEHRIIVCTKWYNSRSFSALHSLYSLIFDYFISMCIKFWFRFSFVCLFVCWNLLLLYHFIKLIWYPWTRD